MNVPRLNSNLVYRTGQQPPPRPHQYSHHQSPQRPSYPLYDDYEYRYDSARPTPRSRRSMDVPRSDPRYGPAALVDDIYMSRRSSHRSPSHHNQPKTPRPHQPYSRPPEPHRLAFDHAASNLYTILTTSRAFFGDLLDAFDREISGIKTYADAKIIESLWRRKIEKMDEEGAKQAERLGHEHQPAQSRNLNLPPPPPPPSGHPIETFYTTSSRLIDALKTAAQSVPYRTQAPPPPPPPPVSFSQAPPPPPPMVQPKSEEEVKEESESMTRLIKKLAGQYKDLIELIEGSRRSGRKCGELVKDLGILLDVLNNSGGLWRQVGVGMGEG